LHLRVADADAEVLQVNKFKSRYAALGAMSKIKTLSESAKEDKDARDAAKAAK
jgi:hypothetical protein